MIILSSKLKIVIMNYLSIRNKDNEIIHHKVNREIFDYVLHLEFALKNEKAKKAFYKKYKE